MTKISVIIPARDGQELLERNLPSLAKALEGGANRPGEENEIIIAMDGENEGLSLWLTKNWPALKTVSLTRAQGFSVICNHAARLAQGQYLLFLNSDIRVKGDFISPLLRHFEKGDVFAVGCREENGCEIPVAGFRFGLFLYRYERVAKLPSSSLPVLFVSAGRAMFNREKFLALGGFDEIYSPFYWEDLDICLRAWQRGWEVIYEPESRVYHRRQATISKFYSRKEIMAIHWGHRFIFMRKNLDDKVIKRHKLWKPLLLTASLCFGKWDIIRGYLRAGRLKEIRPWPESERVAMIKLISRFHRGYWRRSNILYLHETSKLSGAENSLLNLLTFLHRENFSPHFVLPEPGPFYDKLKVMDIPVAIMPFPRMRWNNLYDSLKAIHRLRNFISEKKINLIHSQSIRTHLYAALAGKTKGIPVVWHERNLLTRERIDPDRLLGLLADKIICNSQAIARRFLKRERLPARVKVIYNGVDIKNFNPSISGREIREEFGLGLDNLVIGMASRFSPDKGHNTFLEAVRIILDLWPESRGPLRFLIAGGAVFEEDRWREKELRELTAKWGLNDKVIFTGFRYDMPQLYASMNIFVLASWAEPSGRVIFEAMAMGKPLIATNTGGTPEIVQDSISGILVPPQEPGKLAEAIIYLLKNKDIACRMGRAARERVETLFNIEARVRETESLYRDLLSKRRCF